MTNGLSKKEQNWLDIAKRCDYNTLPDISKDYYNYLMQKIRIPKAVEKQSIPAQKKLVAPISVQQVQPGPNSAELKMMVFIIGLVIIGLAAHMIWTDWQTLPQPQKTAKNGHKIR